MKFTWGTGIAIFLILFLAASAVFIVFAMRQDVNLVEEDYYEKGVDYTEQMNMDSRSVPYKDSVKIDLDRDFLNIEFAESLVADIDSGGVLLYRPSSSSLDVKMPFVYSENPVKVPASQLITGRYILQLHWYSGGLKYEIDRAINLQ